MDHDPAPCETGEPAAPMVSGPVLLETISPGSNGARRYSLERFAGAVGAALAPHDIGVRFAETHDGTRIISAWRFGAPDYLHVITIDTVQICPDEVAKVAAAIKRNLDLAITD